MKEQNENIMVTSKPITIGSKVKINCNVDLDKKEITSEAKANDFIVIQENKDKSYIVAYEIYKFRVNSFDIKVIEN